MLCVNWSLTETSWWYVAVESFCSGLDDLEETITGQWQTSVELVRSKSCEPDRIREHACASSRMLVRFTKNNVELFLAKNMLIGFTSVHIN